MAMKLCIPTLDDRGLQGQLSTHFGSAPTFTLVDTSTHAVVVVPNLHHRHGPGSCETARLLPGYRVDAVVCRGLGHRAFAQLQALGLPVFVSEGEVVGEAVEAHRLGLLRRLISEAACHGGLRHPHSTPAPGELAPAT
jgi:predicted Fe-Mo cluster-binding NifX family protein